MTMSGAQASLIPQQPPQERRGWRAAAAAADGLSNVGRSGSVGVLMPIFNEVRTLDSILEKVLAQPCVQEVVAVDDSSNDGSWERLQEWTRRDNRIRIARHDRNRGKGAAIRSALAQASAPYVIVQDADLEYDPADYPLLLDPLRSGQALVVYGSRLAGGARAGMGWCHLWANRLLTRAANLITGLRLSDEATGYKMFCRDLLLELNLQEEGFGFCAEVTAKLANRGVTIMEVPIRYRPRSRAAGKKIRWRHGWQALYCLLRYSIMAR